MMGGRNMTTERTGRVIRVAVGPAYGQTRIRDLRIHIERAWRAESPPGSRK